MIFEVVTSLFLVWLVWYLVTTYQERKDGPPGPFPLPIIGNLHQLGSNPPFSMESLFEKYGDIYQLKLPLGTFVLLNTAEVVLEAVKEKKDDFAGKPSLLFYPMNEVIEGKHIPSADLGPGLMLRRKFFRTALNASFDGIDRIQVRVSAAVRQFLDKIESMGGEPFQIRDLLSTTIASHTWDWLTAKKCDLDDEAVKLFIDFNENIEYLLRNGILYQMLPFLAYLPTQFVKKLQETKEMRDKMLMSELQDHLLSYTGETRDFTDGLILAYNKEKKKSSEKDVGTLNDLKFLMVDMVGAGFGTSRAVLDWMIFVVASDLDLQAKLRNELDGVVPRDRLPRIEDFNYLHHLQATVCEVMRHSSMIPIIYRRTVRDTTLKGYKIPKNTKIILNIYQSTRNPQFWDEPAMFKPDRFIDEKGNFMGWNGIKAYFLPFGYGHRSCIGDDFGRKIIFALFSSLLHQYTLDLPPDVVRFNSGVTERCLVHLPKDYKVIFKKRP